MTDPNMNEDESPSCDQLDDYDRNQLSNRHTSNEIEDSDTADEEPEVAHLTNSLNQLGNNRVPLRAQTAPGKTFNIYSNSTVLMCT